MALVILHISPTILLQQAVALSKTCCRIFLQVTEEQSVVFWGQYLMCGLDDPSFVFSSQIV